ncbi:MAG TPA: TIM44-like domain-containing protein [Candidatus Eisenbacteria bacterium]|nr:TIM44-like domain-containing protein [Candidatus Eisenbacteria bacterium]
MIYWLIKHYFPGQYLLIVMVMGAVGFVFREILWEIVGHAWLFLQRLLKLGAGESAQPSDSAAPALARNSVAAGLQGIRQHDPTFDAGAFLQQVQHVCAAVKQAWMDRTLEACRGVMTDACWQRQKGEMDRGIIDGWRGLAAAVSFTDGQIVLAATDGEADRIVVRLQITSAPGTGKLVRGRRIGGWAEDWTFVRPITLGLPPGTKILVSVRRGAWQLDRMDHVAIHMEKAQPAA